MPRFHIQLSNSLRATRQASHRSRRSNFNRISRDFVVKRNSLENIFRTSGIALLEELLLHCNSQLQLYRSLPSLLSNNLKKLLPMLFKISHWISGKVWNHLYKERNDRKTGQCFEPINSFRGKNLKLKTGVLQEIRNDFLIGGKEMFTSP